MAPINEGGRCPPPTHCGVGGTTLGGPGQPRGIAGWAPLAAPNPPPFKSSWEGSGIRNHGVAARTKGQTGVSCPPLGTSSFPTPSSLMNTTLEDPFPLSTTPPSLYWLMGGWVPLLELSPSCTSHHAVDNCVVTHPGSSLLSISLSLFPLLLSLLPTTLYPMGLGAVSTLSPQA